MSDIDLKSRYDIGWFSAYDTLKGMVILYGYSKVLEALMEIGNLTPLAADGALCPECDSKVLPSQYCMMGHWCGERPAAKA